MLVSSDKCQAKYSLLRNLISMVGHGETTTFPQTFFQRVWKSLENLEKGLEKLFQSFALRNYYFNAIINSIIFPARVEIHETRFVAGTFTLLSERTVIFKKN